eukprot:scaffold682155_cov90-Prasinocladus_malaysianus.AAC.1
MVYTNTPGLKVATVNILQLATKTAFPFVYKTAIEAVVGRLGTHLQNGQPIYVPTGDGSLVEGVHFGS